MKYTDAYRAQYYLNQLLVLRERIEKELLSLRTIWPDINIERISEKLCERVAAQIDQLLLPVVVYEIICAGEKQVLYGDSSKDRYQSFFVQNNSWTKEARALPDKYPYLFEIIDGYINSAGNNIICALLRLKNDYTQIIKVFFKNNPGPLTDIISGISDRHAKGQQTLILKFESGAKIIYKPVDITSQTLFSVFIKLLELPEPYNLTVPVSLKRNNYGWIEFVSHNQCSTEAGLRNYYRRAGSLIAVADALNYCDGHMENLIASSEYPVLIDTETLFHSFGRDDPELGERSILYTGLVEKPPRDEASKGFTSALQSVSINRYELLYPHAVNDHTDEIAVRYRGYSNIPTYNSPVFNGAIYTPRDFIDEVVNGFAYCYNRISDKVSEWLVMDEWWITFEHAKLRQLIRHTLFYDLLIRKIHQPEACTSKEAALSVIMPLLHSEDRYLKDLTEYETAEILKNDIPFFYHYPGSVNLYDSNGRCYSGYFEQSVMDEIKYNIFNRNEAYLQRNIEILKNILPGSPEPVFML